MYGNKNRLHFRPKWGARRRSGVIQVIKNKVRANSTLNVEEESLNNVPESITYIIQNLKAVYGVPERESDLDPLDTLIQTILSQSTTNVNSHRAFESLKLKFPT